MEGHEYERLKARIQLIADDWVKEQLKALEFVYRLTTGDITSKEILNPTRDPLLNPEDLGVKAPETFAVPKKKRGRPRNIGKRTPLSDKPVTPTLTTKEYLKKKNRERIAKWRAAQKANKVAAESNGTEVAAQN